MPHIQVVSELITNINYENRCNVAYKYFDDISVGIYVNIKPHTSQHCLCIHYQ